MGLNQDPNQLMGRFMGGVEPADATPTPAQQGQKRAPDGVDWALKRIKVQRDLHGPYRSYYSGDHRLMIRMQRLRSIFGLLFQNFGINLCRMVCDAVTDRLQVAKFSLEARNGESFDDNPPLTALPEQPGEDAAESARPSTPAAEVGEQAEDDLAWKIWERNRMQRRAGQLHQESVASGDAYILVWPNQKGQAVLYPHKAHEIVVDYDPEEPGRIERAAKVWYETRKGDGKKLLRVNVYYEDRIERYYAEKTSDTNDPAPDAFKPYAEADTGQAGAGWRIPHPWGVVPIFAFANNADLGEDGKSELIDAVPIQDAINYSAFSLLVDIEFNSQPQKYLLNIETPRDPETGELLNMMKTGPERVWALQGGVSASDGGDFPPQVGQFPAGALEPMIRIMDFWSRAMAAVTGTPEYYFTTIAGDRSSAAQLASGVAIQTADFKLAAKVKDRQIAFGDSWAKAMALAVRMELDSPELDIELATEWEDMSPRNVQQEWQIAAAKKTAGVSQQQILREQGYTARQIKQMQHENQQNAAAFGLSAATEGDGAKPPPSGGTSEGVAA